MNNISAIIVAMGTPKYLAQAIGSISELAQEIIIVDIGLSQLMIESIKKNKKVRIIKEYPVPYIELIREKTKKLAKHKYILFLDPDEIVSPQLAQAIEDNYMQYDYLSIPRKNIIFNKWIQHSRWWPDYQIRLFKKSSVVWPRQLHAQPKLYGEGYKLEPTESLAIIHHNYDQVSDYMDKMNRYAQSEAQEHAKSKINYTISQALKDGMGEFISRYFAADGYKDGMHGFALSFLQLMYYPLVYFYYWETRKYEKVDQKKLINESITFFKEGLYQTNYWLSKLQLISSISKLKNTLIKILLS